MNPTTTDTPAPAPATTPAPSIKDLEKLERIIVKGINAYDERNELICALVAHGTRQADVARALNAVRRKLNAPELTPDAIAATLKRAQRKTT